MNSRFRTLRAGTSRTAALAAELRRAAGGNSHRQLNHLRLLPDGTVLAYDWRPDPLYMTDAQQQAVTELLRTTRRDIDWSVTHDYHLTTGMLRRSPAVGERGYAPEVEGTFGGTDPAFLPRPADRTRRAA